jgi:DNA modification methylase
MVFSDPPYNVPIDGHVCGLGSIKHNDFAMAAGEMKREAYIAFLHSAITLLARHSEDGALHYICIDWRHVRELLEAADAVYREHKNICIWNKTNGGMGSFYRSKHELISVHKHGSAPHINNVALGRHGRNRTNVWDYAGVNTFRKGRLEELAAHPTAKPVAMVADAILDASNRNDAVLDSFLGSGTTILAAERVGRRGYGIELDPRYCDVALRRWSEMTGREPRHRKSGLSFEQISALRRTGDQH